MSVKRIVTVLRASSVGGCASGTHPRDATGVASDFERFKSTIRGFPWGRASSDSSTHSGRAPASLFATEKHLNASSRGLGQLPQTMRDSDQAAASIPRLRPNPIMQPLGD